MMKKSSILRTLVSLSFLLFLLPFLRMCSFEQIESFASQTYDREIWEANFVAEHEREPTEAEFQQGIKKMEEERAEAVQSGKKDASYNFYKFTWNALSGMTVTDKEFFSVPCFVLIFISSVTMLGVSFLNKFKLIFALGITNIVLLVLAVAVLIAVGFLENIDQLLIGFYLFLLNTLLIVWFSRKLHRSQ